MGFQCVSPGQSESPLVSRCRNAKPIGALQFGGSQYQLPTYPPEVRLEGNFRISKAKQDEYFFPTIIWDTSTRQFKYKIFSYYYDGRFIEGYSLERTLAHGILLPTEFGEGVILDQEAGLIRFPSGIQIVGETGEVRNKSGKPVLKKSV